MTNATQERIVNARAKAFSGRGIESVKCMVSADGTVRVWDSVAGHYTNCHAMSDRTVARIRKLAGEFPTVRVTYWAGTTQRTATVSSYAEAMKIIDDYHRNSYDPTFEEIATGRELHDDGNGLCYEDRSVYVV